MQRESGAGGGGDGDDRPMLISLHMPKTAGSSFQATLEAHYGEALTLRYQDRPLHRSPLSRNFDASWHCLRNSVGFKTNPPGCIHGHFLPLRYRLLPFAPPPRFVTWLREPVQRLLSHYHYWLRSYQEEQSGPLHKRMIEENWTLEQFATCRELRNLYSTFLWGFPLTRFDFIGITEHYATELDCFGRQILNATAIPAQRNKNPDQEDQDYAVSPALRRVIEAAHAPDIRLYRQALEMRKNRQH